MTETSGSYAIKHAYDLKAVIVHIGEANYGHYISFLRHNITDDESVWLRCDDEIVEAVPFSVVAAESFGDELPAGRSGKAEASRTAYVLIFQRRKES